jgi:hypothetical protein
MFSRSPEQMYFPRLTLERMTAVPIEWPNPKGALQFGVYTARGTETCQRRPGSRGYEELDAATYCSWDLDYIKIDGCVNTGPAEQSWGPFHEGFVKCFNQTGKEIVMSVESCHQTSGGCADYVTKLANLWRTGGNASSAGLMATLSSVRRRLVLALTFILDCYVAVL